jgi:enoyl-CoA hydratase/carnithine racemase
VSLVLDHGPEVARVALDAVLTAGEAQRLADACDAAAADDTVRALVVSGDAQVFVAQARLADEAERRLAARAVAALGDLRKPTVAVIAGATRGIGLEVALACDLRVAEDGATFALPLAAGLPFCGGTQRLPRVVGRARALDMLLTGRVVGATDALAWGLVTRTAPAAALAETASALLRDVLAGAPLALPLLKEALLAAQDLSLAEGLRLEEDLYALLQTSADRAEGVRAFLARRAPRFSGR